MEAMVKALLAYSRVLDGAEDENASADANVVLGKVLQNLAASITDKQPQITQAALPLVGMTELHLLQVLQNLIGNALKYGPHAVHIQIGVEERGGDQALFVRDNGYGIPSHLHERAFGMFKRLHPDASVQGTGVGLAICKQIVEHYGGRIWIESQAGTGATFLFTVPPVKPAARAALA